MSSLMARESLVDVRVELMWGGLYTIVSDRTPGSS
jgi:hypothetical protein